MVDNAIEQIISDYQSGTIKSKTRLILTIGRTCMFDVSKIHQILKTIGFNIKNISDVVDSYLILSKGTKVDDHVKKLIEENDFIDNNSDILTDLAKIYFYSDSIVLDNNQIIIKKSINNVEHTEVDNTPEIDINKAIQMSLQKIKYNKMDSISISKLQELKEYPKYIKLHDILIKAIEYENRIKSLNDKNCMMNIDELETFLS